MTCDWRGCQNEAVWEMSLVPSIWSDDGRIIYFCGGHHAEAWDLFGSGCQWRQLQVT